MNEAIRSRTRSRSTSSRRSPRAWARSSVSLTAARGGSNSVVMNAARSSRSPAQSANSGHEQLEALIEIAKRAARVRRPRLAEALSERGEHKALATGPASVDRRLRGARAPRDLVQREAAVARLAKDGQGRANHGCVDLRVARPPDALGRRGRIAVGAHAARRSSAIAFTNTSSCLVVQHSNTPSQYGSYAAITES